MSKDNWKTAQRRDATNLFLVTNAERPAKPDSPDGITVMDALNHLGITAFLTNDLKKELSKVGIGIFPESKSGYFDAPKNLLRIMALQKKQKEVLIPFYSSKFIFCRKETFFDIMIDALLVSKSKNRIGHVELFHYSIPDYIHSWIQQAETYIDEERNYKWPVLCWWPKNVRYYKDGLVIMRETVFNDLLTSLS